MPVTTESPAPYTPVRAILDFITKYRDFGLSEPFDTTVLSKIGINESLIPRTLQALQALDLMTEDGHHTDTLEALRLASTSEFKERMAEWIRTVYADIFQFTDPSTGDAVAIRDAFRNYNPRGQQTRMVSLFIGLCKEAGIITNTQPVKRTTTRSKASSGKPANKSNIATVQRTPLPGMPGLPPALIGLLQDLPTKGKAWDKSEHDAFHALLATLLDYYYPASEGSTKTDQEEEI